MFLPGKVAGTFFYLGGPPPTVNLATLRTRYHQTMRRRRSKAESLAALLRAPKRLGAVPASEPDSEEEGEVREANQRRRGTAVRTAASSAGASGSALAIVEAITAPPDPAWPSASPRGRRPASSTLTARPRCRRCPRWRRARSPWRSPPPRSRAQSPARAPPTKARPRARLH